MKYIIACLIIGCLFCCSCDSVVNTSEKQNAKKNEEQVSYKEYRLFKDRTKAVSTMYVIEVEGHKYLYINKGGLIHAESCECLNKN